VRGEDRLLGSGRVKLVEYFLFQLGIFEHRLDRDVGVVARLPKIERRVDARKGHVGLGLADLILLDELPQRPADPFHAAIEVLLLDVPHADVVAMEGRELRDAVAHLPRADHRDLHRDASAAVDGPCGVKGVAPEARNLVCGSSLSVMAWWTSSGPRRS